MNKLVKSISIIVVSLIVIVGSVIGWTFYKVSIAESIQRAQTCYEKGEALFKINNYKEAMWSYEEVSEFYESPHTKWVDLAQEKEWVCRAYLNDWMPSKGPTNGDIRLLKPNQYIKYKTELSQITPVSFTQNQ